MNYPARYDFTIVQGATFNLPLQFFDASNSLIDWSGYTARLQARVTPDTAVPSLDLSTAAGGGIAISTTTVTLHRTAAQTAAMNFDQLYYDLELVMAAGDGSADFVYRAIKGIITFDKEITR